MPIIKTLLDAQISKYNKKLFTKANPYDTLQDNKSATPTASSQLHNLQNNQPLSLVPQNYRNRLAVTERTSQGHSYPQSHVSHIALHQSNIDDTYKQVKEQPHTTKVRSQNNPLFSTR